MKLCVMRYDIPKTQSLRTAVDDGQHIHAEGILKLCFFVQEILQAFYVCPFFQFQNNADTLLGGFVGNINDIRRFLRFHEVYDIRKKFPDIGADHRIWYLCDDQLVLFPALLPRLKDYFPPEFQFSAALRVNCFYVLFVDHQASGRKIRSLDIGEQIFIGH